MCKGKLFCVVKFVWAVQRKTSLCGAQGGEGCKGLDVHRKIVLCGEVCMVLVCRKVALSGAQGGGCCIAVIV